MRRRLILMLLVLALVGLGQNSIQEDVTSTRTMGQVNGLWWRMNTSPEKVVYVIGFMDGVDVVGSPALGGTLPVCPTYVQDWAGTKKVTNGEIVQGIDTFYQNPTNLPLPVLVGAVYSNMKLTGATQAQLDTYRLGQLEAIAKEAK